MLGSLRRKRKVEAEIQSRHHWHLIPFTPHSHVSRFHSPRPRIARDWLTHCPYSANSMFHSPHPMYECMYTIICTPARETISFEIANYSVIRHKSDRWALCFAFINNHESFNPDIWINIFWNVHKTKPDLSHLKCIFIFIQILFMELSWIQFYPERFAYVTGRFTELNGGMWLDFKTI